MKRCRPARSRALVAVIALAAFCVSAGSASAATPSIAYFTGGQLSLGTLQVPITASGAFIGSIDENANIAIPLAGVTLPSTPFATSVAGITFVGDAQLTATQNLVGSLNPATGQVTLSGGLRVALSLTVTAPFVGTVSGTCQLGSDASPMPISLSTTPPGTPYSAATAMVSVSTLLAVPAPTSCSPVLAFAASLLQSIFGGSGRLTLSGLLALPGFRFAGAVGCNAATPQMTAGSGRRQRS